MTIELVYFDGCPNIEAARANIKAACEGIGKPSEWKEWNQNDENAPDYVKGYGSPTILINGKDIAGLGKSEACAAGNCRIYPDMTGVPSVELIQKALRNGNA